MTSPALTTYKQVDKRKLAIVGILAIGGAVALFNSGNDDVESLDVSVKPIEHGTSDINAISLTDRDAALTVFAKQFESVDQRFQIMQRESTQQVEALRKEYVGDNNSLKAQVASLTNELTALRANGIDQLYEQAVVNDRKLDPTVPSLPSLPDTGGLNFSGLNFDMSPPVPMPEAAAPSAPSHKYGPNYFILKPEPAATSFSTKSGGDSLDGRQEFAAMSNPNTAQQQQPQYASAAEAYEAQSQRTQEGQSVDTGPRMERITIPAFSFVEVTTLHGVACPIGANAPGSQSESNIPARPVVLPVLGIFRGPNGSSVDVGHIHLMGLCSGRRTSSSNSGRATIRVEQMSYWDSVGDSQMSASTGYIVDTRDNEEDVYGRLDKASGQTLALQSAAAAGAAFSAAISQAEYTTQNNLGDNGSTSIQQLTGDSTKAATAQGVAAIFGKIAQRFEQQANAAIDTVVVEPGIRLRFVTDQPIHIYKPAESFDLNAGKDVLL